MIVHQGDDRFLHVQSHQDDRREARRIHPYDRLSREYSLPGFSGHHDRKAVRFLLARLLGNLSAGVLAFDDRYRLRTSNASAESMPSNAAWEATTSRETKLTMRSE
jgi:hypothetical protein